MLQSHRDSVVVDCHNDWIQLMDRERSLGHTDSLARRFIPQLRGGGIDVQVTSIFINQEFLPEAALRRTLLLIEHLKDEINANPEQVALCLTGTDIDAAVAADKLAIVLSLEGSHAIGHNVELFDTLFYLGVRMASFAWWYNTALAGGSGDGDPGDGLSRAGLEALQTVERLGILTDVSHLSARSTEDVLSHATRPVVASHSSVRSLCDHHRNLTDEHIKGIAASGGVIGVAVSQPDFIDPGQPTIERVVDHMVHIADMVGIEHVGIGADFVKEYFDEAYATYPEVTLDGEDLRATIKGLESPGDMPALTKVLEERGVQGDDLRKVLGENFLRLFRGAMGTPRI